MPDRSCRCEHPRFKVRDVVHPETWASRRVRFVKNPPTKIRGEGIGRCFSFFEIANGPYTRRADSTTLASAP